ncbi:class I tRNA ligase family protein, partial [Patescibacteria group bacterium]|nr:class I tRNA ligase family protein [Patescibacteria group bacterium]
HKKIEKKWQEKWEDNKIYQVDLDKAKKPFYNLMMFPYPSAEGLHVGNMYAFVHSDVYGRFMKLQGYDMFEPIGLDGFGIHSENYAIKIGEHIKDVSKRTEKHFYDQLHKIGNAYDWSRKVETYNPNYYKWTQWLFLQMYKKNLAYRKKSSVNWCPSCKTVLSDEQVVKLKVYPVKSCRAGILLKTKLFNRVNKVHKVKSNKEEEVNVCERCDTPVEKKQMEQWFWKITDYAERLLNNLKGLDWSEEVKTIQKNWIGKSEGVVIQFSMNMSKDIRCPKNKKLNFEVSKFNFLFFGHRMSKDILEVFTTRPDTLFGCSYMVVCPEHESIINYQLSITNYAEVCKYIEQAKKKSELDRTDLNKDKTGVELKGVKAINPVNKEEIPIFVADYVLPDYGTGAIMAVPAHDERDFEFAKKYRLKIKEVVAPFLRDNPRKDKETEKRDVVTAIVKNPQNNTFLCLNWNTTEWQSFPTGYIEKDDLITAAKREVEEETGYKNIKFIKQIGNSIYAEFYRPHKDSNVYAHFKYLLFELENEERAEISQKEKSQYKAVWVEEKKVNSFINVWNQKIAWKKLIHGDFAYCEEGININSNNTKTPEKSEAFVGSEDCYPQRKVRYCQSINSIKDNKNNVKHFQCGAEPAEGFEPSSHGLTIPDSRHAAGTYTPNLLYQKNQDQTKPLNLNGLETKQ